MTAESPSIGQRLKDERSKRGLSLDDCHAQIRVHPRVLFLLEENRFNELPAAIYTKGFLKQYSDFLNLDTKNLLSDYDRLHVEHRKQSLVVESENKAVTTSLFPDLALPKSLSLSKTRELLRPYLKIILITLCAIAVVAAIWMIGSSIFGAKSQAKKPQVKTSSVAKKSSSNSAIKQSKDIEIIRRNSPYIYSVGQGNFPKVSTKDDLALKIKADSHVWVRVASDGKTVFESILQPGQFKELSAAKVLDIQLGRPKSVTLTLNGQLLGTTDGAKHVLVSRKGVRRLR